MEIKKGQGVVLNVPYLGYTYGELTGIKNNYRYEVELNNGATIWLYDDEFNCIN